MSPIRVIFAALFVGLLLVGVASIVQGAAGVGLAASAAETARSVSPDEAVALDGISVAVRGLPEVAEPLAPAGLGGARPVLYYEHRVGETTTEKVGGEDRTTKRLHVEGTKWVASFRLGGLEVVPAAAEADQLRQLGQATAGTKTDIVRGIWADEEVTVLGRVKGGKIEAGEPFVISPRPREELLKVRGKGAGRAFIVFGALIALVGALGSIVVAAMSARRRL